MSDTNRHIADDHLCVSLQQRTHLTEEEDTYKLKQEIHCWDPSKTAIIICDMWDAHWCAGASSRVAEMAPRMNEVISKARSQGVLIVHAPSDCMKAYRDHPARKLAAWHQSDRAKQMINDKLLETEEAAQWPIDQRDGGCACTPHCKTGSPWSRQVQTLEIRDGDAISDSGSEIAGLFWKRGIENVILMGVHTNMCVIGRSFGLRNMVRLGFNVVLMRDLTDTMYNPESWPQVNHFTGTSLIVEYIEQYVCPSMVSTDFTGEKQFRFEEDDRPLLAFIVAEGEYHTDETLPAFAHQLLLAEGLNCGFAMGKCSTKGPGRHNIENLQILEDADMAVISVRRRALTRERMDMIRDFIQRGHPLLAIRTSSHAFNALGEVPFADSGLPPSYNDGETSLSQWVNFDEAIIGGNYQGHYRNTEAGTTITLVPGMEAHPLLSGCPMEEGFVSPSTLYKNRPLRSADAQVLITGAIEGQPAEPALWINTVNRNQVIYTSLGHRDDWHKEGFQCLMRNSVYFLLGISSSK